MAYVDEKSRVLADLRALLGPSTPRSELERFHEILREVIEGRRPRSELLDDLQQRAREHSQENRRQFVDQLVRFLLEVFENEQTVIDLLLSDDEPGSALREAGLRLAGYREVNLDETVFDSDVWFRRLAELEGEAPKSFDESALYAADLLAGKGALRAAERQSLQKRDLEQAPLSELFPFLEELATLAHGQIPALASGAFNAYADAVDTAIDSGHFAADAFGVAIRNVAGSSLRSIGQQAVAKGGFELGEGFGALADRDDSASAHFRTAAKFFGVAALAGVGAGALSTGGAKAGGSSRAEEARASRRNLGNLPRRASGGRRRSNGFSSSGTRAMTRSRTRSRIRVRSASDDRPTTTILVQPAPGRRRHRPMTEFRAALLLAIGGIAVFSGAVGCATTKGIHPSNPRTIPHTGDRDSAFNAALVSVAAAGVVITVADREAGFIATDWRETDRTSASLLACVPAVLIDISGSRRFALQAEVGTSSITLKPRAETCNAGECERAETLSSEELRILNFAESYTKSRLTDPNAPEPALPKSSVSKLQVGDRVVVVKTNGEKVKGAFAGHDERGAVLIDVRERDGRSRVTIDASEIAEIAPQYW